MNILLIDNYDSFTYNLVHSLEKILHVNVTVVRDGEINIDKIKDYDKIVFSPGPGLPQEAKLINEVLLHYANTKSILGVCLGHQAIGIYFGAKIYNLPKVLHGISNKTTLIMDDILFKNLPKTIYTGHYHSWAISETDFPPTLSILAKNEEGIIMAIRHNSLNICGVQFHPKSVLTPLGDKIMENWVNS